MTTAAVAASVAGLTVIQPLTAAPPLLLAALLMDGGSGDENGVGNIAEAIQNRLLPSDGRTVIVNFLTGPFGIWNALGESDGPGGTVPSTTLGVASSMPFLNQQGWTVGTPALPPLLPGVPAAFPPGEVPPGSTFAFDLPSLQIGDAIVTNPAAGPFVPHPDGVVTSYKGDLSNYAAVTLLNPLALTNSMAAYLNRALSPVKVNPDGSVTCAVGVSCDANDLELTTRWENGILYVTFKNPDGSTVTAKVETRNGTTYVTYDDDGTLPLVRPLRDYFGLFGNELADIIEPALTALVYFGYRDALNGTSTDLLPTPAETIKAVLDFMLGVKKGVESLFEAHSPTAEVQALAGPDELRETALEPEGATLDSETPDAETPDADGPVPASTPVEVITDTELEPTDPETLPDIAGEDQEPIVDEPVDQPEIIDDGNITEIPPADEPTEEDPTVDTPEGGDTGDDETGNDETGNDAETGDAAADDKPANTASEPSEPSDS